MARHLFAILFAFALLAIGLLIVGITSARRMDAQERQIDRLCQFSFDMAKEQGAGDIQGFTGGKQYCLFLADYSMNRAIIGEFDGEIKYDKKPRIVIMHSVREEILADWEKQPLVYMKYKKIR